MQKPSKPYRDFPLFPHNNGQWAKKIKGKLHYFGRWDDPDAALQKYVALRDYGKAVSSPTDATLYELCNAFLRSKDLRVSRGELSQRSRNDYARASERLLAHFGESFAVNRLTPQQLERFRDGWPESWSGHTINTLITRLSAIFVYAYEFEFVAQPIRFRAAFSRASEKQLSRERAAGPEKYFEPWEVRAIVAAASPEVAAMTLLGINAGFGAADCGRLTWDQIDFDRAWYRSPRGKTGQWREAWLWPETMRAIEACGRRHESLVFVTRFGLPWYVDGSGRNPLQSEFRKVCVDLGIHKVRRGHYSLRHALLTVADELGDTVAMRIVLGQKDPSISQRYRERIDSYRIGRVCGHVRQWYLGNSENS